MQTMRYLIIGGGMTAAAAVEGIRAHDADGEIVIVGAEPHPPYKRPLLSKKLWAGGAEEKLWYDPALGGADLKTGRRIVELDLDARRAKDDRGDEYAYDKVLLATGGTPRRLGGNDGDVVYFRTLDHYRELRAAAEGGAHVVVIGGGFIGSELASSLTGIGTKVTLVFPEAAIVSRVLPADLAAFVTDYYREKGVEMLANESVSSVDGLSVTLGSGRTLEGDAVVAGLGIVPSTELAEAAGLAVDNGIVVDELGRVERPRRRLRRGRRRELPEHPAREARAGRARGPRELARPRGRREHGGCERTVRLPPVLLLRHVRPRLRGCRRSRRAAHDARGVAGAQP